MSSVNSENTSYSASELSDGERAIFYILGQVLEASEDSVLIFDEPELHIHKSIISNLWDKVEELRPDCSFLIITHDIEFVATRVAKKYVIRNYYSEPAWDISEIPESDFDEQTVSLILGSRKPTLFVEGGKSSLDIETYRCCYPEWIIIPKGSCKAVIDAVSSLQKLNKDMPLLNIKCAGIVDLDSREDDEINKLNSLNIQVLPVSEIENIFSLPDIVKEILKIERHSDLEIDGRLINFKTTIIEYVEKNLNEGKLSELIIKIICRKIDNYLKNIDLSSERTTDSIIEKLKKESSLLIDEKIKDWGSKIEDLISDCISDNNIDDLLKIYEDKGLLAKTAYFLRQTSKKHFEDWLIRQLRNNGSLLQAIKEKLPKLED